MVAVAASIAFSILLLDGRLGVALVKLADVLKLMRKGQNVRPQHINQQHEKITKFQYQRPTPLPTTNNHAAMVFRCWP